MTRENRSSSQPRRKIERRMAQDPNYKGPERRTGQDRRQSEDRRSREAG